MSDKIKNEKAYEECKEQFSHIAHAYAGKNAESFADNAMSSAVSNFELAANEIGAYGCRRCLNKESCPVRDRVRSALTTFWKLMWGGVILLAVFMVVYNW